MKWKAPHRSFAISGKQSHLSPFYTAAEAVSPQVGELKLLLQNDPIPLQSVIEIEPVIARHHKVMKDLVELGDKNLFRRFGQRNLTDEGNNLMEQIRATFDGLDKDQRALLNQEQTTLAAKADRVTMISLFGSILAGVLVLTCGACTLRMMQGRRRAEEKLDRLLGSMPDALVIINAEGRIIGCNAHTEKLFGYSDRELLGERMALLVPERFRQTQRQYYAGFFSQRGARVPTTTMTEVCGLHKDGREFPIEVSTKPLADKKGLVVTSAIRDISGRKEVEEQISKLNKELKHRALELESANKELEAFSYSVSHDLRSPLQNVDNFSQILMEDYANRLDANGRDYVERLRGSCQHMEDIINALLALSNMIRSELVVEPFDLTALANGVAADVKQKNPDRLVEWVIAEGLTAEGDAQLLRVVLENLFGNAWKFTANRPRARIEFGALGSIQRRPDLFCARRRRRFRRRSPGKQSIYPVQASSRPKRISRHRHRAGDRAAGHSPAPGQDLGGRRRGSRRDILFHPDGRKRRIKWTRSSSRKSKLIHPKNGPSRAKSCGF